MLHDEKWCNLAFARIFFRLAALTKCGKIGTWNRFTGSPGAEAIWVGSGQVRSGRVKTSDSVLYLSKVDRHEARDAELVGDFISQIKPSFRLSFKTDLQRHSSFESIILVLNPIIKRKTSRELQNRGLIRKTR